MLALSVEGQCERSALCANLICVTSCNFRGRVFMLECRVQSQSWSIILGYVHHCFALHLIIMVARFALARARL